MAKKYTAAERAEAIKLAGEIGSRAAADRLDINLDTLYTWQSKARKQESENRPKPTQEELETENIRLRKALAETVRRSYAVRHWTTPAVRREHEG